MKKDKTNVRITIFVVLNIIGILGGIVDGVYYQFFVADHGFGMFAVVPFAVVWSYMKTFPGNLVTALSIGPLILAWLFLYLSDKIDDARIAKDIKQLENNN